MAAVGSKLYLFGGLSDNSGWLSDINTFDAGLLNTDIAT